MAAPTSSGTWVPPGASRNAKSRSEENRLRTAATSRPERSVSVIGSFLSRAATGEGVDFDRITTGSQTSKPFPCPGTERDGLIQQHFRPGEGLLNEGKRDRRRDGTRCARDGRLRQQRQQ